MWYKKIFSRKKASEAVETAALVAGTSQEAGGESLLGDILYSFRQNKTASIGLCVVVLLVFLAVFAPLICPYDPYEMDLDQQFLRPSAGHWFGTDRFGRDLFTRVVYGTRISLLVGLVPSFIAVSLGGILGVFSGYVGGRTDFWIMRLADVVMAFPSLLLALVVMYTLGATLFNIFIALSLVGMGGGREGCQVPGPVPEGNGVRRGSQGHRSARRGDHGAAHFAELPSCSDRPFYPAHPRGNNV